MEKYHDALLTEDYATLISFDEKDGFIYAVFDETIFYPGGGGQPHDKGMVESDDFKGEVLDVLKKDENIIHKISPISGRLKQGDRLRLKVDKDRRIRLVKMHTGEHILFQALEKAIGKISLVKIDLDEKESSLFIDAEEVCWERLFVAEDIANKIITEDRPMIEKEYSLEEIESLGKLRIKLDRIKAEKIRVMEVKDFDWSACTGIHAPSTGFVGSILITGLSSAKGRYEIRFMTDVSDELFKHARIARISASILETDLDNVVSHIKRLQEESLAYKDKFRKISLKLLENNQVEKLGRITLIYNVVEGLERKQLIDRSNASMSEGKLVCFISTDKGRADLVLASDPMLGIDIPSLMDEIIKPLSGRGGGRDNFASGSIPEEKIDDFLSILKKKLSMI